MSKAKRAGASEKFAAMLALAALLTGAGNLRGQAPEAPKPAEATPQAAPSDAVIRTESRMVLVDTVVTDKKGHYVTDLTQGDFKVFEDNKEQAIASFSNGSDPAVQAAGQKAHMFFFFA